MQVDVLKELCHLMLKEKCEFEDLRKVPQEYSDMFLQTVYDDLESAVEHYPGWKKNQPWNETDLYLHLYTSFLLLSKYYPKKDSTDLIKCRSKVLNQENLTEDGIQKLISEYMG